jgi:hypothetical protein
MENYVKGRLKMRICMGKPCGSTGLQFDVFSKRLMSIVNRNDDN